MWRNSVAFTDEDLRTAVVGARSWAELNRRLGLPDAGGGAYARIKRAVADAEINTSHLRGHAWNQAPIETLAVPFTRDYDPANLHRVGAAVATADRKSVV